MTDDRAGRLSSWLINAMLVGLAGWIAFSIADRFRTPAGVGKPAPALELRRADGGATTRLTDHAGKVVLVDFWATWCGPCRSTMPVLERIHQKYQGKGVVLLSVNTDAGPSGAAAGLQFAKKLRLTFPVWRPQGGTMRAWNVDTIPHMAIVDGQGVVRAIHIGVGSAATLERELTKELDGLID